jgi:hypothetical protein
MPLFQKSQEQLLLIISIVTTILAICLGIVQLFGNMVSFTEFFLILIAISAISFGILIISQFSERRTIFLNVRYEVTIGDKDGLTGYVKKIKTFYVKGKHENTIYDRNIAGEGKVEILSNKFKNHPHPIHFFDRLDCGTHLVTTHSVVNFARNQEDEHTLEIKLSNSFTENTESFSAHIDRHYRELTIIINFPHDRPCKTVRGSVQFDSDSLDLSQFVIFQQNHLEAELIIQKPKQGGVYILEWDW